MRDITKCHPRLQTKAKELIKRCEAAGLKIAIGECLRTVAEQDALYAQGRTKPGAKVTNAKGSSYSSCHQWGIAFDIYRNDGNGAFNDADCFFSKVGKIGQSLDLEWGGSWTFVDKPHFQLPDWGSTPTRLKALYGSPDKFMATWKKSEIGQSETGQKVYNMKTIKKGSTGKAVKVWQIIIGASPDGVFGAQTESATKSFQKSHGLTADGIVGSKTWQIGLNSI